MQDTLQDGGLPVTQLDLNWRFSLKLKSLNLAWYNQYSTTVGELNIQITTWNKYLITIFTEMSGNTLHQNYVRRKHETINEVLMELYII